MKSGLKDEFEKKVTSLRHRLTQRGLKDPSFWLFNQMAASQDQVVKPQQSAGTMAKQHSMTGRNKAVVMFPGLASMEGLKLSEKDRQFEFYLKSAQKAIDIMRGQQQQQQQLPNDFYVQKPQSMPVSAQNQRSQMATRAAYRDNRSNSGSHSRSNSVQKRRVAQSEANIVVPPQVRRNRLEAIQEKKVDRVASQEKKPLSSQMKRPPQMISRYQKSLSQANAIAQPPISNPETTSHLPQVAAAPKILANLLDSKQKYFKPLRAQGKLTFAQANEEEAVAILAKMPTKENRQMNSTSSAAYYSTTSVHKRIVEPNTAHQQRKPQTSQTQRRRIISNTEQINNTSATNLSAIAPETIIQEKAEELPKAPQTNNFVDQQ
ncbi:hypothetical protein FGO68_gene17659 [Halteria grandinella]|uniref:Uncharacterized protein n=1 Tax=Halteria grandinella TaxID=5974 RepID=A0A8J8NDJ5_HALGN|nr:hypothetical protein FGO68_gene17659 [Halteria grandinella]